MPPGAVTEAGPICSVLAAGNAFCQAAQLHLQLQSKHDAATCFVDAGNAFKKADPQGKGLWEPQVAEQLSTVPHPQVSAQNWVFPVADTR